MFHFSWELSITLSVNTQVLAVAYDAFCNLSCNPPQPLPLLWPHPLWFSHSLALRLPRWPPCYSPRTSDMLHLRAFARAVPSVWSALSPEICLIIYFSLVFAQMLPSSWTHSNHSFKNCNISFKHLSPFNPFYFFLHRTTHFPTNHIAFLIYYVYSLPFPPSSEFYSLVYFKYPEQYHIADAQ